MSWNGHTLLDLEEFCPVAKTMGPWYSWSLIVGTVILYGAQCVWAAYRFYKRREVISKFYAYMIVFNIFAMTVVTWRMSLCMPAISFPLPDLTCLNATFAELFVTNVILVLFPTHTCNNVCRLVYDVKGQQWAKWMLPLAWLSQGWLLIPANMGMRFGLIFLILTAVDYLQHSIAIVYWSLCLCKKDEGPEQRSRYVACVIGVVAHCLSIVPFLVYAVVFLGTDKVVTYVCLVWMIVFMLISQHSWIRAAELTRPEGYTQDTRDATMPNVTVIREEDV